MRKTSEKGLIATGHVAGGEIPLHTCPQHNDHDPSMDKDNDFSLNNIFAFYMNNFYL